MRCVNCEAEIPEGEKFCPQCGVPVGVAAKCPHCGAPLLSGERFCGECGRDVTEAPAVAPGGLAPEMPPLYPPETLTNLKKRSPWLWVLIIVGGLALLGCIIVCAAIAVPAMLATPTPTATVTYTPSPTATETPTATPLPPATPTPGVQAGALRLEEDFSAPAEGRWEVGDVGDVSYSLENGQYAIRVVTEHWMAWDGLDDQFANFQIEFETALVEGHKFNSSGIFFRYQDKDNFYSLDINGNGKYAVGKEVAGEWQDIIAWKGTQALRLSGEPNLIRLIAYGDRFMLYINNELVDEFVDSDYGTGDIALHVTAYDDPPAQATFDNLKIWDVEVR